MWTGSRVHHGVGVDPDRSAPRRPPAIPLMISRLRGTLLSRNPDAVEIETTGGVVYEVEVPTTVLERLPAVGEPVEMRTVQVVREDS
ncbi:MAG: hypothetical protein JSU98_15630, partial [Gemmatimonadales bacterium]